jgi:hypothetical protein
LPFGKRDGAIRLFRECHGRSLSAIGIVRRFQRLTLSCYQAIKGNV